MNNILDNFTTEELIEIITKECEALGIPYKLNSTKEIHFEPLEPPTLEDLYEEKNSMV